MAASYCLALPSLTFSKPKLGHHAGSLNLQSRPSRTLSMAHFQDKHLTSSSPQTEDQEVTRRLGADFVPDIWDGHFISTSTDMKPQTHRDEMVEELKEKVKGLLSSAIADPSQQLIFIDKIQRLGVAYHFEAEIDQALQHIHNNSAHNDGDLEIVALRFRLLRQAGRFVSPDVFTKFKDEKGDFLASLRYDLQGLLSLYEAAHLGCKGEDILDEAIALSTQHLNSLASQLNLATTSQVRRALHLPLHKRFQRVEVPYYISVYDNIDGSENDVLLQLAKLDYNALQLLHRTEIAQISRWEKEVDIPATLPFRARERLVEGYVSVMIIIPEPKYTTGRILLGKLFYLLTFVDDLFDAYGTIAELQSITDAISRWEWDTRDTDELPGFAEAFVVEIYNVFDEIEEEMATKGLEFTVPYFKSETQRYVQGLLEEAKQFHNKTVPPLEEWLQLAATTIGIVFLSVGLVLAHWDLVTKEAMDWSVSEAKMNYSSSRCGRLLDDIHTFKSEQDRGNMTSSITCYMKEHAVEEDEAVENIKKMVIEHWKEMNKECLEPTSIPLRLVTMPLNIIRLAHFLFLYGTDGYGDPKHHKEIIASLLVNPVRV